MVTRTETAAATRQALVRVAAQLLDEGGPDAVTLRAVGAAAGVSRGAPYGHFENKDRLLTQLAIDAWDALAGEVEAARTDEEAGAGLERAMLRFISLTQSRPHLFSLMFTTPLDTPEAAAAAGRLEAIFLRLVADVVGEPRAPRSLALVMASAYGIAGMELGGHLHKEAWQVDTDQLVHLLVEAIRQVRTDL